MRRIFEPRAYAAESLSGCYWPGTATLPEFAPLSANLSADVVVIGAGFTGLSAALHLAQAGQSVVVLEAQQPGWGASGRNGGFCCRGGAMASGAALSRRFGHAALAEWEQAEVDAIALVRDLLNRHGIEADTHSQGETLLAHSPRAMGRLRADGGKLIEPAQLSGHGITGPFHGALVEPAGFALNPRKYLAGLLSACIEAGVEVFGGTPVTGIAAGPEARCRGGTVRARALVLATNGYSSEDVPEWMAARYMPVQSNVMVTRVMTPAEQEAQGWASTQMCYDTRILLHYFRMLPEGRMLFGMRGGLRATARADRAIAQRVRADFDAMFPAWRGVETTHMWSGLACLTRDRVPYVGSVPGLERAYAGFAWHGNGVAMGSLAGRLLAGLVLGQNRVPKVMRHPPRRVPFGRFRRALLPAVYAGFGLMDRFG